jgi:hypothetical protein
MKESICSVYLRFGMNRVLSDYMENLYAPARDDFKRLSDNDRQSLRGIADAEQAVRKNFDSIRFVGFQTNADGHRHLVESDRLDVACTVDFGRAQGDMFQVELFYSIDGDSFRVVPMQRQQARGSLHSYSASFKIEGYGLQNINARIRPANEIIRRLYPDLVKWRD